MYEHKCRPSKARQEHFLSEVVGEKKVAAQRGTNQMFDRLSGMVWLILLTSDASRICKEVPLVVKRADSSERCKPCVSKLDVKTKRSFSVRTCSDQST